jgi:hypothetical protein
MADSASAVNAMTASLRAGVPVTNGTTAANSVIACRGSGPAMLR